MSKLLKITFEYDDKIRSLEGEAATEWDKQINGDVGVAWVHGIRLTTDKLPWKTSKKKTNNQIIKLIEEEIEWCLKHKSTNLSPDFQKGFASGLKQAINIITAERKELGVSQ